MDAPSTIAGTAIALGETGVLIRGEPGSGKTALALSAIALWQWRGLFAALVADDQTLIRPSADALIASPVAPLTGYAELRFLALVERPVLSAVRLGLVVDLVDIPPRLPAPARTITLAHRTLAVITAPASDTAQALLCLANTVGPNGELLAHQDPPPPA